MVFLGQGTAQQVAPKPGDVVQLKSGGPLMTVKNLPLPSVADVLWFDSDLHLQQANVSIVCLRPAGATDLDIVFSPTQERKDPMANKKATGTAVKCPCLAPKGGGKGKVMPDITLTTVPSSITLQPVDAGGNPVALTPADTVTGTLTSDSASFVIGPGADTLHYVATIPANTPLGTVANLAATLKGTIQSAPADLTASVKVTLNIPPSPVAVDLDIIIA